MDQEAQRPSVQAALHEAVENAYRVFSRYRPSYPLNICHCDVCLNDEAAERELASKPLRTISGKLLGRYTDAVPAGTDAERSNELRYFLPRYFELIAANDPPDPMGLDICLRRLSEFPWRSDWRAVEVEAIENFFDAYLPAALEHTALAQWPAGWSLAFDLTDVLTMIATAGGDIPRVLAVWEKAADPTAAIHMAALRRDLASDPVRLIGAHFSGEHEKSAELIGAFLARPEVDVRLEAAFFQIEDPRLQKIVSDATWNV